MATYPASGTVESNFGIPQGSLDGAVKVIEYILDADAATTAKFVTGDVINIAALPANTAILGGQVEVLDASAGGTAVPATFACNTVSLGAFTTTQINTTGTKSPALFPAPGASTVLSASTNVTMTMGTVTGTVTKNGKYKVRLFVIKGI